MVVLVVLHKAARKVATADARKYATKLRDDFRVIERAYLEAKPGFEALEGNPDDPAANLLVGKFYCFVREEWIKGLPYLKKAPDDAIRKLAEQDWDQPTDPEQQAALAEGWAELAENAPAIERSSILRQASNWYRIAHPALTGLQKAKVGKAIQELGVYNLTPYEARLAKQFDKKTYLYVPNPLTWKEAEKWCTDRGGHLVCIASRRENEFVVASALAAGHHPKQSIWLGGTDSTEEGTWRWVDGSPWGYANWSKGQPDNAGGGEHFLNTWPKGAPLEWNDITGTFKFPFVAQWRTE